MDNHARQRAIVLAVTRQIIHRERQRVVCRTPNMSDGVDPVELRKLAEEWRLWAGRIEITHKALTPQLVLNLVAVLEHCAKEAEALAERPALIR